MAAANPRSEAHRERNGKPLQNLFPNESVGVVYALNAEKEQEMREYLKGEVKHARRKEEEQKEREMGNYAKRGVRRKEENVEIRPTDLPHRLLAKGRIGESAFNVGETTKKDDKSTLRRTFACGYG